MFDDRLDVTISGRLTVNGTVFRCPQCGAEERLTVYGPVGGPASVQCPGRHRVPIPTDIDPVWLLNFVANDPRAKYL